jgi:hypothetical protein
MWIGGRAGDFEVADRREIIIWQAVLMDRQRVAGEYPLKHVELSASVRIRPQIHLRAALDEKQHSED